MVNDRPTVYNTSSVYAEAGGTPAPYPGLPSNYTKINSVKYEKSGSSPDILIDSLNFDRVDVDFEFVVKKIDQQNVFKYLMSVSGRDFRIANGTGQIFVSNLSSNQYISSSDFSTIKFKLTDGYWTVNGQSTSATGSSFTVTQASFVNYGTGFNFKTVKAYKKENNAITTYYDLIPVKNENNVVGFFDVVQQRFFTNSAMTEGE